MLNSLPSRRRFLQAMLAAASPALPGLTSAKAAADLPHVVSPWTGPLSALSLVDTTGKTWRPADLKGRAVLLNFWASWCEPCRAENPVVVAAYHKYKSKNFDIIGVALESGEKGKLNWLQAIKEDNLPWTQVSDFKYWKNEVALLFNIQSVPANFLVNPEGIIIARNLRGKELEAKLAEIYAQK